jgi:poly-gamma-glutamate synthesis protein (capsule biosynthesis protein)
MTVQLGFTGDLFVGRGDSPPDIRSLAMQFSADVRLVVNFEGTLNRDAAALKPTRQKILLTSPVEAVRDIACLRPVVFCIGNNHIGDYGNDVAQLTYDVLAKTAPVIGAGYAGTAFHLTSLDAGGIPIGLAAYCTGETSPLPSTSERFGPRQPDEALVRADVTSLRQHNRHLIAIIHWGDEYHHYPTTHQLRYGRWLVDSGFDLVIGSHSHSVQGYEQYRGRYIFYSLGNFSFPDYRAQLAGLKHDLRWMARCRWGIVPVFAIGADVVSLQSVALLKRTGPQTVSVVDDPGLRRRLGRFSRAVASPRREEECARRRALESWFIRFGEFSVKDRKLAVLTNKARRFLARARPGNSDGESNR